VAYVAACSEINTKHINTLWAGNTMYDKLIGASRDQ